MNNSNRSDLRFVENAREAFAFLGELGFSEIEALPTLLRYRNGKVEVDVYHRRHSYEVGAGITAFGARYAISEIIRSIDSERTKHFRYMSATTPQSLIAGLGELGSLMRRYGRLALDGDPLFFLKLEDDRKLWAEEFAYDVLTEQLRPKANDAFRQKKYSEAVELYSRIRRRLSPVEIKKLKFAEQRSKS